MATAAGEEIVTARVPLESSAWTVIPAGDSTSDQVDGYANARLNAACGNTPSMNAIDGDLADYRCEEGWPEPTRGSGRHEGMKTEDGWAR